MTIKSLAKKIIPYVVGGLISLNAYGQKVNTGFGFTTKTIKGKSYNEKLINVHGVPYRSVQVDSSEKNPLGVELIPYIYEKSGKTAVFVPESVNADTVYLKQTGNFGISGDKKTFSFAHFMDGKNPMGDKFDAEDKDYSKDFYTMTLPNGDTTFFFYDITDKSKINSGKKLNFLTAIGNGVKPNEDGKLYMTKSGTNKFFSWVADTSRTKSPTSKLETKVDTNVFSVVKSNHEVSELNKYKISVCPEEYKTIIKGVNDSTVKYVVINASKKLACLDKLHFDRSYNPESKKFVYKTELNKIKLGKVKGRKDLVTINGINFKSKAVTQKDLTFNNPSYKKIKVSDSAVYTYEIPVEDLKNVKFDCDSCGYLTKTKIDTSKNIVSTVLNPGYPQNFTPLPKPTTGEVEKIVLSKTRDVVKKNKKNWKFPSTRLSFGADGYLGGVENPTSGASGTVALQINPAKGLWTGPYATYTPEYFSASSTSLTKSQVPKVSLLDIDGNLDGVHTEVYDKVDSSITENLTVKTPWAFGLQTNFSLGENSDLELKLGAVNKLTSTLTTGTKDVSQYMFVKDGNNILDSTSLMVPVHLSSDAPVVVSTNEWKPEVAVGYNRKFGKHWATGLSVNYSGDFSGRLTLKYIIGGKNEK
jgi:hypothetical protein